MSSHRQTSGQSASQTGNVWQTAESSSANHDERTVRHVRYNRALGSHESSAESETLSSSGSRTLAGDHPSDGTQNRASAHNTGVDQDRDGDQIMGEAADEDCSMEGSNDDDEDEKGYDGDDERSDDEDEDDLQVPTRPGWFDKRFWARGKDGKMLPMGGG